MTSLGNDVLSGVVGGLAGGAAMTLLITQVAPRIAPQAMLPPTPAPIKAAQWAERTTGQSDALSSNEEKAAGLAAHAVFSAGAGGAYGLARAALLPLPGCRHRWSESSSGSPSGLRPSRGHCLPSA